MVIKSFDPFLKPEQIKERGAIPVSSVEELFECQFVSLHIPFTPETKECINGKLMEKMPKNAVLINSARPEVVHEGELLATFGKRATSRTFPTSSPRPWTRSRLPASMRSAASAPRRKW